MDARETGGLYVTSFGQSLLLPQSCFSCHIIHLENGGDACSFFSVGLLCHIPLQFLTGITGICLLNALIQYSREVQLDTPVSIFSTPSYLRSLNCLGD